MHIHNHTHQTYTPMPHATTSTPSYPNSHSNRQSSHTTLCAPNFYFTNRTCRTDVYNQWAPYSPGNNFKECSEEWLLRKWVRSLQVGWPGNTPVRRWDLNKEEEPASWRAVQAKGTANAKPRRLDWTWTEHAVCGTESRPVWLGSSDQGDVWWEVSQD